jgi:magnesium transporter
MQKILFTKDIGKYEKYINPKVIKYVKDGQIQTFECFADFSLFAFEWYDVDNEETDTSQILIYLDRQDLFIMCEDQRVFDMVKDNFIEEEKNERALYTFFVNLLRGDTAYIENFETEITESENEALVQSKKDYNVKIMEYRKELLRLKRYYEQLDDIIDNITANDNELISQESIRHFAILGNRTERFRLSVLNLRDYVTQMREAYQAQIDIEQNNLMRIFTVITAVFLPLTLMVGWYGMNFTNMPELTYKYGYFIFVGVSVVISIVLLLIFKKKKWF